MGELDRASICARIQEARERAGLTQPELAEALDPPVHWRTVQTWESVKDPRVPWDRLDEIARITGVTKEWLLHGDAAVSADPDRLQLLLEEVAAVRQELATVRGLVEELRAAPAPNERGAGRAREARG